MRYREIVESAPPALSRQHMLDAISHADVYGDRGWELSDFEVRYMGLLSMGELSQFDDFSSWVEVDEPDDLHGFRQGEFNYPAGERMPPVIIITAPDPEEQSASRLSTGTASGGCNTQIGDGRGRINYAHAHNEPLHVYHMIYKGCGGLNEAREDVVYDQAWHDRRDALRHRLNAFAGPIKDELGLKFFTLYPGRTEGDIELDLIVAGEKSQGAGTSAMTKLCNFADENGLRIILKVADKSSGKNYGTTSRARLVRFYHRFGFKMNTGANRDKRIQYFQMYRLPKS